MTANGLMNTDVCAIIYTYFFDFFKEGLKLQAEWLIKACQEHARVTFYPLMIKKINK